MQSLKTTESCLLGGLPHGAILCRREARAPRDIMDSYTTPACIAIRAAPWVYSRLSAPSPTQSFRRIPVVSYFLIRLPEWRQVN